MWVKVETYNDFEFVDVFIIEEKFDTGDAYSNYQYSLGILTDGSLVRIRNGYSGRFFAADNIGIYYE